MKIRFAYLLFYCNFKLSNYGAMEYPLMEWTDERVKRFWDYESNFPGNYFTFQVGQNLLPLIKKYAGRNSLVLDYGSGPGFLLKHLTGGGFRTAALEFSGDSLEKIRAQFGNCENFAGAFSMEEITDKGLSFDVVTLIEVIEHLDDHYLTLTMDNIRKLLKPGGLLLITTPNNEDLSKSLIICPESGRLFHRWQHVRSWNKDSLVTFLKAQGFIILKAGVTDFNFEGRYSAFLKPGAYMKFIYRKLFKEGSLPHLFCLCTAGK